VSSDSSSRASTPAEPPRSSRRLLRLALIASLTIVVAWIIGRAVQQQGFEWSRFTATFREIDWPWLMLSACLGLLTYLGRALRWQVLIRAQKRHSSVWNLGVATAIGFTAIVLFGRPGEMVRPYLIAVKEGLSFSSQVAAWLLERIYDLLMALLIFGYALAHIQSSGVRVGEHLQWVLHTGGHFVGALSSICLIILFLLRQYSEIMKRRFSDALSFLPPAHHGRLTAILHSFTDGVQSTKDSASLLLVVAYSVLEWVLIVAAYVALFRAVPPTAAFSLNDILIFLGFVAFGSVIQIPGIGGGMQVVAVVVMRELFDMPLEVASGVALLTWLVSFVVIVPFGLALAVHEGLNWKNLRRIGKEAAIPS